MCNKNTTVNKEGKLFHLIFMKVDNKKKFKESVQAAPF